MISFNVRGSTRRTEKALATMSRMDIRALLEPMAQEGVQALAQATPKESGLAASSWGYRIIQSQRSVAIVWTNSDNENGFPVAVMLQYGYATGTGGFVHGRDYINPAMKPIFDEIANRVWRVVTSA